MQDCDMTDMKSTCNFFTWKNKQRGSFRVYSKINRVMANSAWLEIFTTAEVGFLNEDSYDHAPGLLTVYPR